MLPVEANGDVVDCQHWGTRPIGNVKTTPFAELLKSPRLAALAAKEGESCHKCVSLHRIEISEVWDGNLEPLLSWRMLGVRTSTGPAGDAP
jgi:MoaA/NifB/PqqE/SkfB family radical SAM enzyme